MTAFMIACQKGFVAMMQAVFTGEDFIINDVDYLHKSPLMLAIVSKKLHAVKWLVEHGADLIMSDRKSKTVLQYAERNAEIKEYIVRSLAEKNNHMRKSKITDKILETKVVSAKKQRKK